MDGASFVVMYQRPMKDSWYNDHVTAQAAQCPACCTKRSSFHQGGQCTNCKLLFDVAV